MAGESARDEARRAREKAERLARRAAMFEKGAEGETATAAVLAGLPAGWTAIHDVRWPSRRLANIDHILVGPGGIFVIDSKNWSGQISVANGHLRQNGRSRMKAVAGSVDAALAVAQLAGPYADKVFPVLSFATEDSLSGWCADVMVCSTSTLTQMLASRPTVLNPSDAMDARFRLDAQLRAATSAPLPTTVRRRASEIGRETPAPVPRKSSARSRRAVARRKMALSQMLVALVFLGGFLAYGPQISQVVGGVLGEQFTKGLRSSTACDAASPGQDPKLAKATAKRKDGAAQQSKTQRAARGKSTAKAIGPKDTAVAETEC